MSGFFFVPSAPVLPEFSPGSTAAKKGETKKGDDFGVFLDAYFKNIASFATPLSFPVSKSCGSSTSSEGSTSLPCPLGSAQSATSLSCPNAGESSTTQALAEFPALFSDLLEMVENFSVTLRLEGGNVTVSGARSEDGVFSFSVEGKKEALVEFFTLLLENLRDWVANEPQETSQCGKIQCGRILEDENNEMTGSNGSIDASTSQPQETEGAGDAPVEVLPSAGEGEPGPEIEVVPSEPSLEEGIPLEGEGVSALSVKGDAPVRGMKSVKEIAPSFSRTEKLENIVPVLEEEKKVTKSEAVLSRGDTTSSFVLAGGAEEAEVREVSVSSVPKEFARVFEEVLKLASETRGRKEIVLRLEPEHLGSITVRLEEQGGRIHCLWEVANPETRELLIKYLPLFEAQLNAQGMPFQNFLGDGRNAYAFLGFRSTQNAERDDAEEISFEDSGVSRVNLLV